MTLVLRLKEPQILPVVVGARKLALMMHTLQPLLGNQGFLHKANVDISFLKIYKIP